MFELTFDPDTQETHRVFPRPRPVEIHAARLLPAESRADHGDQADTGHRIPPMWFTAGALDARPMLHGAVLGEYLVNNRGKVGLLTTAVGSHNGRLSVAVVQLVPTSWYRYTDLDPDQQRQR